MTQPFQIPSLPRALSRLGAEASHGSYINGSYDHIADSHINVEVSFAYGILTDLSLKAAPRYAYTDSHDGRATLSANATDHFVFNAKAPSKGAMQNASLQTGSIKCTSFVA
jgi:hypothetical protein